MQMEEDEDGSVSEEDAASAENSDEAMVDNPLATIAERIVPILGDLAAQHPEMDRNETIAMAIDQVFNMDSDESPAPASDLALSMIITVTIYL